MRIKINDEIKTRTDPLVLTHVRTNLSFFFNRDKKPHGLFFLSTSCSSTLWIHVSCLNREFLKLSNWSFVHFMIREVWGVNFLCLILLSTSFVACESLRFRICEFLLFMNFVDVHHCLMLLLCPISYCLSLSLAIVLPSIIVVTCHHHQLLLTLTNLKIHVLHFILYYCYYLSFPPIVICVTSLC